MTDPTMDREPDRLAALRRYEILDTPPDRAFDRIVALTARLFAAPIAMISFVDADRIWFKARHGLDLTEIDRDPGLCASTILQEEPWVVPNARQDARSRFNPLVTGQAGIRFYAGAPLRTHDGFNLGTLCIMDTEPRVMSRLQLDHLAGLAMITMDHLEQRILARHAISGVLAEKDKALRRTKMRARELEHRVMNGLHLVSTTLQLQSRAQPDASAARHLMEAADRVATIARVHRHIHSQEAVGRVDCRAFLEQLCGELSSLVSVDDGRVLFHGIDANVAAEHVAPLGVIVSELVTNAAKHGDGRITVSLRRPAAGRLSLEVSDEGAGLSADFDPAAHSGFGMKLVCTLAQAIGGTLTYGAPSGRPGVCFSVTFDETTERLA